MTAVGDEPDTQFLSYCAAHPEADVTNVLNSDFLAAMNGRRFADDCLEHMADAGLTGSDRYQERDLTVYLPNHNLLYTDKMGMAVGLEARVPFLDLDLVEAATRYPASWKLAGGTTKAVLRDAARGVVSDDVIDRPKAGFGAPYRKWLRDDLAEMWDDLLGESSVRKRGWFDPTAVAATRRQALTGRADTYMLQWALMTVELWARRFVDRNPAED
jgi:asparagine synthase (glutamine-hydrolysing)